MNNFVFEVEYVADDKVLYIGQENSSGCKYDNCNTKEDIVNAIADYVENYAGGSDE